MEKLVNCKIVIDIEHIERITGGDQFFEIFFTTQDKGECKIVFDNVWDMRYSIENGSLDRFSKILRAVEQKSGVLLIENSEYIRYFERQVSGTRPTDKLKNYILYDAIDTVIEILSIREPTLFRIF